MVPQYPHPMTSTPPVRLLAEDLARSMSLPLSIVEEWLHRMASKVELPSPPPPLDLKRHAFRLSAW